MQMMNSYFHAPVAPWVRHLARWFRIKKMIRFTMQCKHAIVILVLHTKLHLKLDCNLQTTKAKAASVIDGNDAGSSAKQTIHHCSFVV